MAYHIFESKIDRITQDYLSKRENLALTIGVVEQKHPYIKGFGKLSDTVSALPNAGTIYEIASVTKLFTVTVLAKLVIENTSRFCPLKFITPTSFNFYSVYVKTYK